jgi:hypothetical protein
MHPVRRRRDALLFLACCLGVALLVTVVRALGGLP